MKRSLIMILGVCSAISVRSANIIFLNKTDHEWQWHITYVAEMEKGLQTHKLRIPPYTTIEYQNKGAVASIKSWGKKYDATLDKRIKMVTMGQDGVNIEYETL